MVDQIQPVTTEAGDVVATGVAVRNNNEEGAELALHSGCQDWAVAHYKANYRTSLDTRLFSANISYGRNKAMFDRQGTGRDTDMGASERR